MYSRFFSKSIPASPSPVLASLPRHPSVQLQFESQLYLDLCQNQFEQIQMQIELQLQMQYQFTGWNQLASKPVQLSGVNGVE